MTNELSQESPPDNAVEAIRSELAAGGSTRGRRISEKFVIAALGAIPWVGGFIAAAAQLRAEEAAFRQDELRSQWLAEHEKKLADLATTLDQINQRFESLGGEVEERIQSPEYLALVREAFRTWDQAGTEQKRKMVANLITNCAGTRICSDDVVRLFISWLNLYHDAHFAVIREIYQNPGSTRFDIWTGVYGNGKLPREDSAEADLYKMLIRDLSTGGVLRQTRGTNEIGQFVRKRPVRSRGPAPTVMESAFEDTKKYVLTELGKQFVHYTMNEAVGRLGGTTRGQA